MHRPGKPARTVRQAKRLRREMSLPEGLLWQQLRSRPLGLRFRNQHPAGPYVLDFFCARANLAIEIDGIAHEMGDRPQRDGRRDEWLNVHRIGTVRIPALEVLRDPEAMAESIVALALSRIESFGKAPPSALRPATSPSSFDKLRIDGEDRAGSSPSTCDGEVASRSDDGRAA
jgi:very-short-patch-repair endonuclease